MGYIIPGEINIEPFIKSSKFLEKALSVAKTDVERAGAIQAFEMCYEQTWKILRKVLFFHGIQVASPRETFRAAAAENLIKDLDEWFGFIAYRNSTSHVYNEEIAENIFLQLPRFSSIVQSLITLLQEQKI